MNTIQLLFFDTSAHSLHFYTSFNHKTVTVFLPAILNIRLTVQNGGRVDNNPSFSGGIRIEPSTQKRDILTEFFVIFLIPSAEMLGKYFNLGDIPAFNL